MPQPDLIVTPFGENAPSNAIDDIPESRSPGDLLEKATWSEGFPGLTMIPLSAGGIPPRGQDFNGVLKAISEHVVFQGGGGQYAWRQEWVDANGGYPAGAVLASNDGMNIYVSTVDNNDVNFNTTPSSIGNQWLLIAGTELSTVVPQAEAEVGTATTRRAWTAQRVRQAIKGWWSGIRANHLPLQSSIPQVPDAETVQQALAGLGVFAGDGYQNIAVFNTTGVTNWTVPDVLRQGLRKAHVTVIGGGGGAGRVNGHAGAGGSGGGIAERVLDLTDTAVVPVTVGSGGAGRKDSSGTGGTGGTSSFGAYCSASGGDGGTGNGAVSGRGGFGLGGDYNSTLGPGTGPTYTTSGSTVVTGGVGGGPGGRGTTGETPDSSPGPGGGGGGSRGDGGDGAPGIVIVRW